MQVKGKAIVSTLDLVKRNWGEANLEKVMAQLPEEYSNALAFKGCSALWYPFDLYIKLTEIVINQFFEGEEVDACRQLGAETAKTDDRVAVKLFYKLGTPEMIIRLGTWAFRRYFDEGEVNIRYSKPGINIFEISKLSVLHPYHYERVAGWMNMAIQLSGGKDVQTSVEIYEDDKVGKVLKFTNMWQ